MTREAEVALTAAVERLCGLVEDLRVRLEHLGPPSPGVPVDLLDADAVARTIAVSPRTLRRLRARRGLPRPVRGPGPLRWRRRDLEAYLERVR